MDQPYVYNDQQIPFLVNNDGRQNVEPFSEQDSNIGADLSGLDQQRVSYGVPSSIHPLALQESDSKQIISRGHDAAFNFIPGMSLSQQTPAQRSSSGGSAFGAPDPRYDLPPQHSLHDGYLVDTHGSCNFGNLPKPSSNFPNYLDAQLPRPVEARTLPSSLASPSGVPPGSSSSATLSPISPSLGHPAHEGFPSPVSSFPRHELVGHQHHHHQHHHLPDFTSSPRSHYLSMAGKPLNAIAGHYGYPTTPMDMDAASPSSRGGGAESLPFQETRASLPLCDGRQRGVNAEIHAKIDKGFFQADGDWTCYRRNYFAVACSYKLKSEAGGDASGPIFLRNKSNRQVDKFAMSIAACIDNDENKGIELVQHTPKRDKGPQTTPEKKILNPNPTGQLGSMASSSVGAYPPSSPFSAHHQEAGYYAGTPMTSPPPPPPPPQDEQQSTTYERIQFKKATANNGKRRAAQQYFYILVELYAGYRKASAAGKSTAGVSDFEWHKVAVRMSAQMVVRGRSPGHYSDNTRPSSSMGPGMGGGDGGSTGYYTMGGPSRAAMGSAYPSNRMHTSSGYSSHGPSAYSNRGMMHMADNLELVPSLSSCSTLDDSSVSGDGSATVSTHSPFSLYNNGMAQMPGMMSPQYSLPPSTSSISTPRPQMLPSTSSNFFKTSPVPQHAEYKPEPMWPRRNDFQQRAYNGTRYKGGVNTGPGYVNSNDTLMRDCRPPWQAPLNDGSRTKWEPMST